MTRISGHHEVREFFLAFDADNRNPHEAMPTGWKPFAAHLTALGWRIVARKWVRDDA